MLSEEGETVQKEKRSLELVRKQLANRKVKGITTKISEREQRSARPVAGSGAMRRNKQMKRMGRLTHLEGCINRQGLETALQSQECEILRKKVAPHVDMEAPHAEVIRQLKEVRITGTEMLRRLEAEDRKAKLEEWKETMQGGQRSIKMAQKKG